MKDKSKPIFWAFFLFLMLGFIKSANIRADAISPAPVPVPITSMTLVEMAKVIQDSLVDIQIILSPKPNAQELQQKYQEKHRKKKKLDGQKQKSDRWNPLGKIPRQSDQKEKLKQQLEQMLEQSRQKQPAPSQKAKKKKNPFTDPSGPYPDFLPEPAPKIIEKEKSHLGCGAIVAPNGLLVSGKKFNLPEIYSYAPSKIKFYDISFEGRLNGKSYPLKLLAANSKVTLWQIVSEKSDFKPVKIASRHPLLFEIIALVEQTNDNLILNLGRIISWRNFEGFLFKHHLDFGGTNAFSSAPLVFNLQKELVATTLETDRPIQAFFLKGDYIQNFLREKLRSLKTKSWIGIYLARLNKGLAYYLGIKHKQGVIVRYRPEPNSPARRAGLRTKDTIKSINGRLIKDNLDLAIELIENTLPKSDLTMVVIDRRGRERTVRIRTKKKTIMQILDNTY
jgi:S1-C subfamily serine protease